MAIEDDDGDKSCGSISNQMKSLNLVDNDGVGGRQQNEKGRYPAVGPRAATQLCGTTKGRESMQYKTWWKGESVKGKIGFYSRRAALAVGVVS